MKMSSRSQQKFYKGDIILLNEDERGNPLNMRWGGDLIGVYRDTHLSDGYYVLFHRPVFNWVRWFIDLCLRRL